MSAQAGVYLHIPFCRSRCGYCDFYSNACADPARLYRYADALCGAVSREEAGVCADTVYFGGGTPSLLGARELERILTAVRARFVLSADAEITLEANPGELCLAPADGGANAREALELLRGAGFNRISLGVQSMDDAELRMISRRHTARDAAAAVRTARAAGFDNLSLDLIYALPGQTMQRWEANLEALIALEPEHISCYALKLSPEVPLYRLEERLPDDDTQLAMYLTMVERLSQAGYAQYEISNFARPGRESRHNSKYWTGADYYGIGPSAHSLIRGMRSVWTADVQAFIEERALREDCEAADEAEEYLMLRLRMTAGLDPEEFSSRFGQDFAPFERVFRKYEPHGLCRYENGRWILTPRGAFVSNGIISELFVCLEQNQERKRT